MFGADLRSDAVVETKSEPFGNLKQIKEIRFYFRLGSLFFLTDGGLISVGRSYVYVLFTNYIETSPLLKKHNFIF